MNTTRPRLRRLPNPGAAIVVAIALVAIALGLVVVVGSNLETSADIRKESEEAYLLGEMQIAVTAIETSVSAWLADPASSDHPAASPAVAAAVVDFRSWVSQLRALIDEDEIPIVQGFEDAFDRYLAAVVEVDAAGDQRELQAITALDLQVRVPLLQLLQEESEHLLESVVADRRSERFLRWGLPVLLILALAGLAFVVRLQNRSQQLDEQRRINEAKNAFIASVSHEVRTPLTPVVAYAHELRDRMDDFSREEVDEFVGIIAHESDEVAAIVQDLLVAARLDIDQLTLSPEALELTEQVEQALLTLGNPDEVRAEVSGQVLADGQRLRQILRNLVVNAQRYGGGEISITSQPLDGEMLIVVADSGPGIPPELTDQAFEPFAVAHVNDGVPDAVGLGLSISKNLADLMGGNLTYARRNGQSELRLLLPTPGDG